MPTDLGIRRDVPIAPVPLTDKDPSYTRLVKVFRLLAESADGLTFKEVKQQVRAALKGPNSIGRNNNDSILRAVKCLEQLGLVGRENRTWHVVSKGGAV